MTSDLKITRVILYAPCFALDCPFPILIEQLAIITLEHDFSFQGVFGYHVQHLCMNQTCCCLPLLHLSFGRSQVPGRRLLLDSECVGIMLFFRKGFIT